MYMPQRKTQKSKNTKSKVIKQKQKQSIVINIDNKGRKTRARNPRVVKVGSSNPSLGTSTIYTYPLQLPIYNADHNSLKTLTETLTNAFNPLPVPSVKSYQPALNVPQRKRSEFFSLDEVKIPSTPLVPIPVLKPSIEQPLDKTVITFKKKRVPAPALAPAPAPFNEERVRVIPRKTRTPRTAPTVINPNTKRPISVGGDIYNQLKADGYKF